MDWHPIPFGDERRAQTRRYAERHYGLETWKLKQPAVIVEHMAAISSPGAVFSTFAANQPDPEVGELPGVCAHFLVADSGKVYQYVRTDTICRHVVGLNYTAIGIEHTGTTGEEVFANAEQLRASLRVTRWLACRFQIKFGNVIGHAESVGSPFYIERDPDFREAPTHGDWPEEPMDRYRKQLRRMRGCDG